MCKGGEGESVKNFIKNTWFIFFVIAVVAWADHYHGEDIPFLLKVLGFLVLLGIAAVYDKLTKIQTDSRVTVRVQIEYQGEDDIFPLFPRLEGRN